MSLHELKLIVISKEASLGQIETVLGPSVGGGHDLGSARENGLVRKQSIWVRRTFSNNEMLEDIQSFLNWNIFL